VESFTATVTLAADADRAEPVYTADLIR